MPKDKTNSAILLVLIAGILWSFGALVVRYIEDARSVPWQYLFFRGLTIFVILNLYLFFKEGKSFIIILIRFFIGSNNESLFEYAICLLS